MVSTEGVLVETACVLEGAPGAFRAAVNVARSVRTEFLPFSSDRIDRALALMDKYRDVPMDFVDALLVAAAEEVDTDLVFTLDRRGFDVYRLGGTRAFTVLPEDPSDRLRRKRRARR